jgi:hypothetical protein
MEIEIEIERKIETEVEIKIIIEIEIDVTKGIIIKSMINSIVTVEIKMKVVALYVCMLVK